MRWSMIVVIANNPKIKDASSHPAENPIHFGKNLIMAVLSEIKVTSIAINAVRLQFRINAMFFKVTPRG